MHMLYIGGRRKLCRTWLQGVINEFQQERFAWELVVGENTHGSTTVTMVAVANITVRTCHKSKQSSTHNICPYTFTTIQAANPQKSPNPLVSNSH